MVAFERSNPVRSATVEWTIWNPKISTPSSESTLRRAKSVKSYSTLPHLMFLPQPRVTMLLHSGVSPAVTLPRASLTGATDMIQSIDFNPASALHATTDRDRKVRIYNPRAGGEAVLGQEGHVGIKGAHVIWMGGTGSLVPLGSRK